MVLDKIMLKKLTVILILLSPLTWVKASEAEWQSNIAESRLSFAPSFEGLPINGGFNQFSVSYSTLSNGQPASLLVKVVIGSVDLSNEDLNQAVQAVDWFDTETYPQAIFSSQNIVADSSGNDFLATGTLTLKGAEKPVEVPFKWRDLGQGKASMAGELILGRSDFAIGTGEWASGDQIGLAVRVWFDVLLVSDHD